MHVQDTIASLPVSNEVFFHSTGKFAIQQLVDCPVQVMGYWLLGESHAQYLGVNVRQVVQSLEVRGLPLDGWEY